MTEQNNLKIALKETSITRIIEYIPESNEHTFSLRFRRRMKKLIHSQKKMYQPQIKFSVRKTVAITVIAVIVALSMAMSVSAIRNAFIKFVMEIFDSYTSVQNNYLDAAPVEFSDVYEITDLPEGFVVKEISASVFDITTTYEKGNDKLEFTQSIKKYYDLNVNTEGYQIEYTKINGDEGYIVNMSNQNALFLSWDNDDYIFTLFISVESNLNIGKNELICIAESVKKVE